jgi:hypothetical protein
LLQTLRHIKHGIYVVSPDVVMVQSPLGQLAEGQPSVL